MKLSDCPTHEEILAEEMKNPEFRAEYERTAFAHEISMFVLRYRTEHGMTIDDLARQLDMTPDEVTRLEASEYTPSFDTLQRLAEKTGTTFTVEITAKRPKLRKPNLTAVIARRDAELTRTATEEEPPILELTREQIVTEMERVAQQRLGMSAAEMVRRFRTDRLGGDWGQVAGAIALGDLLDPGDPLSTY